MADEPTPPVPTPTPPPSALPFGTGDVWTIRKPNLRGFAEGAGAAIGALVTWPPVGWVATALMTWVLVTHGPGGCTPTPQPPVPIPVPVPPDDPDEATLTFRAAYVADPDKDKAAHVGALAEILGGVVAPAKKSGTVTTAKDLQDAVHRATNLAIGEAALPKVRPAVGAYLAVRLPTAPAEPMTDALWAKAATEYARAAAALRKVK